MPVGSSEIETSVLPAVFERLLTYLEENKRRDVKVRENYSPEELRRILQLDEPLPQKGRGLGCVTGEVESALKYSVRTGHLRFFNSLFANCDEAGLAGEFTAVCLNTPPYTFEIGPLATMLEHKLIQEMCSVVGFEGGEGIFNPGGSLSTFMGVLLARHNKYPEAKQQGNSAFDKPQVVLCSSQAHYSVGRAASMAGFGTDNVVKVDASLDGAMDMADLERKLVAVVDRGANPLCVVATAGTTVLGGFDNIDQTADLCARYGAWLHVDGSQGMSVVLSSNLRHHVQGIEKADSLCWNPHKMMGIPQQCSVLLTAPRHLGLLQRCNGMGATYLFHPNKAAGADLGDRTIQCGRKFDALKLWFSWQVYGTLGFQQRLDHAVANTAAFETLVRRQPEFHVVAPHVINSLGFWCMPAALSKDPRAPTGAPAGDDLEANKRWLASLSAETVGFVSAVQHKVRANLKQRGLAMVNYQPLPALNIPYFFRLTVLNPGLNPEDMEWLVGEFVNVMAGITSIED